MLKSGLQQDKDAYRNIRDVYSARLNDARKEHYSDLIIQCAGNPRKLFSIVNSLSRVRQDDQFPPHNNPRILADRFGEFFCKKIELIKNEIDKIVVDPPQIVFRAPSVTLERFRSVSEEEVREVIMGSSNAFCALDPIPTWLLKQCCDVLTPVITQMVNLSLQHGYVPDDWKVALVLPQLKKMGLDLIFENFRPVSNLPFAAKTTENIVTAQLLTHCEHNAPLPSNQSSYRKFHSTETALLKVQNDILTCMDNQEVTLLILLDLSAAFDVIDHSILLKIIEQDFGIIGNAQKWLESFLASRKQRVMIKKEKSKTFNLNSGVPQGSCLGPILFLLYSSGLFQVVSRHLPDAHGYADDTQMYLSFKPVSTSQDDAIRAIENCVAEVRAWMVSHKLLLNDTKTEFLIIGSRQQLSKVTINSVRVGDSDIEPVDSIKNLGSWFDKNMSMDIHIGKTCRKAFFSLYKIRQIRKFLTVESTKTLVHAIVTCHLDYCNSLLFGLPKYQYTRLQRVLNVAARLVCLIPKFDHITPVMIDLHWLPVKYRVHFKILLLVFKSLHGLAPTYISDLLHGKSIGRYHLRSDDHLLLSIPRTKRKTFGDRSFASSGPTLWNALPIDLKNLTNIDVFKRQLKTYLFKKAFDL